MKEKIKTIILLLILMILTIFAFSFKEVIAAWYTGIGTNYTITMDGEFTRANEFCISQGYDWGNTDPKTLLSACMVKIEGSYGVGVHCNAQDTEWDTDADNDRAAQIASLRMAYISQMTDDQSDCFYYGKIYYGKKQKAIYGFVPDYVRSQWPLSGHLGNLGFAITGGSYEWSGESGMLSDVKAINNPDSYVAKAEIEEKCDSSKVTVTGYKSGEQDYIKVGPLRWKYSGSTAQLTVTDQDDKDITADISYEKIDPSTGTGTIVSSYSSALENDTTFYLLIKADGTVSQINSIKLHVEDSKTLDKAILNFLYHAGKQDALKITPGSTSDTKKDDDSIRTN